MGRILWGVFQRLFIVIKAGGATALHGELMDSSAYLSIVLISLIHNFSMGVITLVLPSAMNILIVLCISLAMHSRC